MNSRQQEHETRVPDELDDRDRQSKGEQDAMVDYESEQSFPASDSPSWTLGLT